MWSFWERTFTRNKPLKNAIECSLLYLIKPVTLSLFCRHFFIQTSDSWCELLLPDPAALHEQLRCFRFWTIFFNFSDCLQLVAETAAHAWGQWSASIHTPTSGACVPPWPRGEEVWVWQLITTSSMLWADTTHLPLTTVLDSLIVSRGR